MASINTINKAVIYSTILDEVIRAGLTSAPLEAQAGSVKYNGGGSCQIAKITTGGYGAYDRGSGYPQGAVTQEWETKTITQDRGIKFTLDVMDEDETANVLSATNVITQFSKTQAIPELDAYRYSTIFQNIVDDTTVKYGYYTPAAASLLSTVQGKIADIRDAIGENEPLVIFMSGACFKFITTSTELQKQLMVQTSNGANGISTKIFSIDGVQIIPVPSNRLKTEYAFSATNSYAAKSYAQDINFIIMSPNAAVAFVKHNKTRVIGADVNQSADGELVLSRTYHDLWVYDNKKTSIYVSLKTSTIDDISSLLTAGSGKVTYTLGTAYTNRDTGHEYYYKNTASAAAPTVPACYDDFATAGYTKITTASATDVTVTATHYLVLAHLDENGRVIEFGKKAAS